MNFWPAEEPRLTTTFPFFDWYAGACSKAMLAMQNEWVGRIQPEIPPVQYNHTVISALWDVSANQVRLEFAEGGPPQYANLAIIVSGFGDERTFGDRDQKSYWRDDELDALAKQSGKLYVVAGTGDGGLLDFLRLVHRNFANGLLCAELLNIIDTTALKLRVSEIEGEADHIRRLRSADPPLERDAALSLHYQTEYTSFLEDLPRRAVDLLGASLKTENYVTLIGLFPAPFEYSVAPLHKIILAHALAWKDGNSRDSTGRPYLSYETGTVDRRRGAYYLQKPGALSSRRLKYNKIIIRFGADRPPLSNFVTDPVRRAKLISDQLAIMDDQQSPFPDGHFVFRGYPPRNVKSALFVNHRKSLANELAKDRFSGRVKVAGTDDNAFFAFETVEDEGGVGEARLPLDLFGITLVHGGAPAKPTSMVRRRAA
jgi:hypothetical protein